MSSASLKLIVGITSLFGVLLCGCSDSHQASDPLDTVSELLAVHGLAGKDRATRSRTDRETRVNPEVLQRLIVDYRAHDPFLAELYVGFVVGALARYQGRLVVERDDERAFVSAGRVSLVMLLGNAGWQIHLDRSIPESIKAKAKLEQARIAKRLHRPLQKR